MTAKRVTRPTLIRNASWVIAFDATGRSGAGRHVYRRDVDLKLADGAITEIAAGGTLKPGKGDTALDARGKLVMPGLVNIHSHPSTEPAYRGVREDHGVPEQNMTGLFERSQAFNLDVPGRRAATTIAYGEMLASGVTTVADLSSAFDGWLDVMRKSRLRVYAAPGYASARWGMSSPAVVTWRWDEAKGREAFERTTKLLDEIDADPSGRLKGVVYPMQVDTVTEELFRASHALAEKTNRPLMSHLVQTVVEVREMIRRHGMTPVEWAQRIGVLSPRSTWGHCIFIDEHPQIGWHTRRDIAIMAESGMTVAHCPSPFARYGAALGTLAGYQARGVNVGLGTDVAPHNLIEEMRVAILAARVTSRDIRAADPAAAFHAATIGGAKALGRDDLGRIAKGARADLVLVDLAHPLMQPARDPLRALVWHAADRAVHTVLIDGEVVFSDGRAPGLDIAEATATLSESQARMLADAPKHDYARRSGENIAPLSLPLK